MIDNARHSPHADIDHTPIPSPTTTACRRRRADGARRCHSGTAVAVEFNLRAAAVRFFKGTVMRSAASACSLRDDDTYLDYDIAHARLFIPSPTAD